MSYLAGRLILIGVITCLPACVATYDDYLKTKNAGKSETETKLSNQSYRYSSSDTVFKIDWNTLQKGSDTVIDGLTTNVRDMAVRDIKLTVTVLDANGRILSKGADLSTHYGLNKNEFFAFNVILKNALIAEGSILKFEINYRRVEGSWGGGGSMQSSISVDAATGVEIK